MPGATTAQQAKRDPGKREKEGRWQRGGRAAPAASEEPRRAGELCPSLSNQKPHFCPKSNFVTGAEAATNISFIASANLSGSLRHKMSLPVNFEQPLVWAPQRSPRGGTPERLRKL